MGAYTISHPGIGDNNYYSNKYMMTSAQLDAFTKDIASFWKSITSFVISQSPQDYINSLRVYPFDIRIWSPAGTVADNTIKYGWQGFNIEIGTVYRMIDSYDASKEVGVFTINKPFEGVYDFLNYQTTIEMFLPYYGTVNLNPHDVYGKTIRVKYIVNFSTGTATIVIFEKLSENEDRVISTFETTIGVQYPLGGPIASESFVKNAVSLAGIAIGAVAGGAVGIASGAGASTGITGGSVSKRIASTHNVNTVSKTARNPATGRQITTGTKTTDKSSTVETSRVTRHIKPLTDYGRDIATALGGSSSPGMSSGGGLSWFYLPQKPFITITKPIISAPTSYNMLYGRPCNTTVDMSSMRGRGFTQIAECRLTGNGIATDEEKNEILEHLEGGVIL